jgi:uncharacterized repeat protein (TIGR01451 family)
MTCNEADHKGPEIRCPTTNHLDGSYRGNIFEQHPLAMARSFTFLLIALLVRSLTAQTVFIPDPQFRAKLNTWAPGLVDANGFMPENNWDLHPTTLDLDVDWSPANLLGLEHVQISGLRLAVAAGVQLVGVPVLHVDLYSVEFDGFPGSVAWPVLPVNLGELIVRNTDHSTMPTPNGPLHHLQLHNTLNISALPDLGNSLISMTLYGTGVQLVNVEFSSGGSTGLQAESNPALETIEVIGALEGMSTVVLDAPNLTSVSVSGGGSIITLIDVPALTTIGPFEEGLAELIISGAGSLTTLPSFPSTLTYLSIVDTQTATIPELPAGLQALGLAWMPVTTVGPFPPGLGSLTLSHCPNLATIPALPPSLGYLQINNDPLLTVLPTLPDGLYEAHLYNTPIASIDYIPPSLVTLIIDSLAITSLPPLTGSLTTLDVRDCPLVCLPLLPFDLEQLVIEGTNLTCQPNHPPNVPVYFPLCTILTSSCPEAAPYVSGTVFWDRNGNGVQDTNEPGLPGATITEAPYGYMAGTDSAGHYEFAIPLGQHTLTVEPGLPNVISVNPPVHNVETTTQAGYYPDLDLAVVVDTIVPDLRVLNWWLCPPRPGYEREHAVVLMNLGTTAHNVQVRLAVDPLMQFVSSTVPPAIEGNELVWDMDSLAMGQLDWFFVTFFTPVGTPLGTEVAMSSVILPFEEDVDTLNNVFSAPGSVVGSYDPNDKQVTPAMLTVDEGTLGRRVEYFIRFQNTGNLAADRVLITDTLDAALDPTTFQFLGASHACEWFFRDGALHFLFDPIFLPDSTSDEPGSHGSVLFSIETRPGLMPGDVVPNLVNIYFDFNEPVITEPCDLEVEVPQVVTAGAQQTDLAYPVPTSGLLMLPRSSDLAGTRYRLVDATGMQVLQGRMASSNGAIDLSGLPQGLYVLHVETKSSTWSQRVMKE